MTDTPEQTARGGEQDRPSRKPGRRAREQGPTLEERIAEAKTKDDEVDRRIRENIRHFGP